MGLQQDMQQGDLSITRNREPGIIEFHARSGCFARDDHCRLRGTRVCKNGRKQVPVLADIDVVDKEHGR